MKKIDDVSYKVCGWFQRLWVSHGACSIKLQNRVVMMWCSPKKIAKHVLVGLRAARLAMGMGGMQVGVGEERWAGGGISDKSAVKEGGSESAEEVRVGSSYTCTHANGTDQ